jgi:hypothetical protein
MLRHAVPDGDLAEVLDRALTALLRDLERAKAAWTVRPRPARPVRRHCQHRIDDARPLQHVPVVPSPPLICDRQ